MGRVIVIQYLTLDGVVEDPDGSDGTPFGGWAMRYGPEGIAGDKFRLGPILESGVLLFGRRTWEHFAQLWPSRTTSFALAMNSATKAVLSNHPIDESVWSNSTRITGELETWLRETLADRDVVVIGSGSIVARLAEAGLVDEYRLITFPIAVGAGRALFPAGAKLQLTGTSPVGPATYATYVPE